MMLGDLFEGFSTELQVAFFAIAIVILVVVILFISYFDILLLISNFAYPNARVKAVGTPLLKKKNLEHLSEQRSVSEVMIALSDIRFNMDFGENINPASIDMAIRKKILADVNAMQRVLPDSTSALFKAIMLRYEGRILKIAVRSALNDIKGADLSSAIFPYGYITESFIQSISEAKSKEELLEIIKSHHLMKDYAGGQDVYMIENHIDKIILKNILNVRNRVPSSLQGPVTEFTGRYVDIYNLNVIFRGIMRKIPCDKIESMIINKGFELPVWKLKEIMDVDNVTEAASMLEGTFYHTILKEGMDNPLDLEAFSLKALLHISERINSIQSLTLGPSIKFLVSREIEERNLRSIIFGVMLNHSKEMVSEMLISDGAS